MFFSIKYEQESALSSNLSSLRLKYALKMLWFRNSPFSHLFFFVSISLFLYLLPSSEVDLSLHFANDKTPPHLHS